MAVGKRSVGARRVVAAASSAALVAAMCVVFTAAPALAAPPAYAQIAGSPFPTGGTGPTGVAYSPVGGLVAASNGNNSFSVFTAAATGALTLGPNSPFPAGSSPRGVAFSPSGSVVAVANFTGNSIMTFGVQANANVTGLVDTESTGGNVAAVAFSPNGQFVAAAENSVGRLFVWSVDAAGNMAAAPGSPITSTSNISSLAWTANNGFIAVADNITSQVSVFSIAGTGQPTLAFGPVATGSTPTGVAINPAGTILATSNNGSISTFPMAANGTLGARQDFARTGQLRSVKFRPDGQRLAAGGGSTGLVYVEDVAANGVLAPVSGSPFNTFGAFNWEAAWSPNGAYIAVASGNTTGAVNVLGPYDAPVATCSAAEIRASKRNWVFGVNSALDFGVSGTALPTANLAPGAFNAPEGSTTVSDTSGLLLFYTDADTVYDRTGAAMPNGTGLGGSPSAVQPATVFPAIGRPGVYFLVTTSANLAVPVAGTLRYSEVDMNLRGGLGDVTAVKSVQLGVAGTASEALNSIPNSTGTGFWVLTQQWSATNLLAYQFNGSGPVTGTAVVSVISAGSVARTINVSPDLTQLVMNSNGKLRVLDFDGLDGAATERYGWSDTNAFYGADFSPSGNYVYASGINAFNNLNRYLVAGQPDSAAVAASGETISTTVPGQAGQVLRGPDGRMWVANQGAATVSRVDNPDAVATPSLTSLALAANARSQYGLPQTATGCALPAQSCVVPTDFTGYTRIDGGPGPDIIDKTGQAGPFVIFGGGGQDLITGGTGNDIIFGGDGNDRLSGGPGDDRIFGDAGNDNLFGNDGNDALCGNDGNDSLEGGNGNDLLEAGAGFDRLYGQAGNDRLIGGKDNDYLDGGAGDNTNLDSEGSNMCVNPSPCGPTPPPIV